MRALVVTIAIAAIGADARADDPRDMFGLGKPKKPATAADDAPDCASSSTFGCASATDPLDDRTPYALATSFTAAYLLHLPVADATQTAVAAYALGASRDESGTTLGGATGLENRWSIEGAPTDDLATGSAGTLVPLTFLSRLTITSGGFSARDRASTGGTVDAELLRGTPDHRLNAYVWSGLSLDAASRPTPNNTYYTRRIDAGAGANASASVTATGPIAPHLWYALGIAPAISTADFTWTAARVLDEDGDHVADGAPGHIATRTFLTTSTTTHPLLVPAMARVGYDRGPHHVDLTLVGALSTSQFFRGNATMQAAGIDSTDWIGDGIATYRGTWRAVHAKVQVAWHRSVHREAAHDAAAANLPQTLSAFIPDELPEDPALAAACADGSCPVPLGFFASGGAGALHDRVGDRPSATAELAHGFGGHVARIGGAFEDTRLVTTSRFTGGELDYRLTRTLLDRTRFYAGICDDDPAAPCDYASESQLTYRTRYAAAYVEDTFSPVPNLRVDGGVRWELMWVGPRLHFSNQLAPRLGASWDPLGNGRSRVFASLGRSFAMLPAGTGETLIRRDATVDDVEFPIGTSRAHDGGQVYSVAEGIQPMAQDEVSGGVQVGLPGAVLATLWGQGRYLRRGLDTVGNYFDNPGREDGDPPATRATEIFGAEVATTPAGALVVRAGYAWGHTTGTFAGPFDPRQGAALYDSTDWNSDPTNSAGPLPTDIGHRVYVELQRGLTIGPVALYASTRLTVGSGRPRTIFANGVDGIEYLVPRGTAGRGPLQSQANVRLAARWRRLDITLDVMNVFDRTDATSLDELYTNQSVRPIDGGTYTDLVFLKTDAGVPAAKSYSFHLPTAYRAPFDAVLGLHASF